MDGTLEQPAHTNDKTLTGHAEKLIPLFWLFSILYQVFFFLGHKNVCLSWISSNHRWVIALIVTFYLVLIC